MARSCWIVFMADSVSNAAAQVMFPAFAGVYCNSITICPSRCALRSRVVGSTAANASRGVSPAIEPLNMACAASARASAVEYTISRPSSRPAQSRNSASGRPLIANAGAASTAHSHSGLSGRRCSCVRAVRWRTPGAGRVPTIKPVRGHLSDPPFAHPDARSSSQQPHFVLSPHVIHRTDGRFDLQAIPGVVLRAGIHIDGAATQGDMPRIEPLDERVVIEPHGNSTWEHERGVMLPSVATDSPRGANNERLAQSPQTASSRLAARANSALRRLARAEAGHAIAHALTHALPRSTLRAAALRAGRSEHPSNIRFVI